MPSSSEFDLDFTCLNPGSISRFDDVISSYLGARADVPERLTSLLEDEPEMPMALCLQGYLLKLAAHPKLQPNLKEIVSRTKSLPKVNPRERLHIMALNAWAQHRDEDALAYLEEVLVQYPTDMCALRVAHYLHFYRGKGEAMAASTERVSGSYNESMRHYGYFLGMHAFGLEESGQLDQAEQLGRQAAQLNPADLWAVHAVAHALYTKGEYTKGVDWLRTHEAHWEGTNNFRYHLYWHIALNHLQQGDFTSALALYDAELEKSLGDDFYLDVCNNASLLWRLEHRGVNVGERWQEIAEISKGHTHDQELVFASLHYLLALHRTQAIELSQAQENLTDWSVRPSDQGSVCKKVGLAVSEQLIEPASLDWHTNLYLVGGSHAQRELFKEL